MWESAAFSSIFPALSFSCSQTESTPAHTQVPITAVVKSSEKTLVICANRTQKQNLLSRLWSRGRFSSFWEAFLLYLGNASPPPSAFLFAGVQQSLIFLQRLERQAQFLHPRQHFIFRRQPSRHILANEACDVFLYTQLHQRVFGELFVRHPLADILGQAPREQ